MPDISDSIVLNWRHLKYEWIYGGHFSMNIIYDEVTSVWIIYNGEYTLPVNSLEYCCLERDFNFTDCKMDCIRCSWFRNIWPQFLKMVWIDFCKQLPWKYMSCSFEWTFTRRQGGRSAERPNGVRFSRIPLVETTFGSGQCHAIFQGIYCKLLLGSLVKGPFRLILPGLQMSHKVPLVTSWSRHGRLDLRIGGLLVIAIGFPHPRKTDTCWWLCALIGFSQVPGKVDN